MQQHLGRQSGVQKVQVSLIDGKVEITPKADGSIDPVQLLKATYDSGVSVAEMTVTARGKVVKNSTGGISLQTEPSHAFAIADNEFSRQLEGMAGSNIDVTLSGFVYRKQEGQKKQSVPATVTITITEIQDKEK